MINADNVNIRTGPSLNFRIVDSKFIGDHVELQGRNNRGSWLQFVEAGELLWVWRGLVDVQGDVMTLPIARPTIEG